MLLHIDLTLSINVTKFKMNNEIAKSIKLTIGIFNSRIWQWQFLVLLFLYILLLKCSSCCCCCCFLQLSYWTSWSRKWSLKISDPIMLWDNLWMAVRPMISLVWSFKNFVIKIYSNLRASSISLRLRMAKQRISHNN